MKHSINMVIVILLVSEVCIAKGGKINSRIIDVQEGAGATGTWRTKLQWRYYWVKDWELKQMYVPTWKKVWSPIEIREWFPFPSAPPPPPLPAESGHKLQ